MDLKERDIGTWVVLMQRYERHSLPRARRLLERVEQGRRLSDGDIEYLLQACEQSRDSLSLVIRNPSYTLLFSRTVSLYASIVDRAVENERNGGPE